MAKNVFSHIAPWWQETELERNSTSLVATMVRHVERKAISPGTKKSPA
jgi:hypothetical protein